MSLSASSDSHALSLGVELLPDGSINTTSIILTPSLIRVTYGLTYDDVDEMLEEGIGFSEEWQLGALLDGAKSRRKHRCDKGCIESYIQGIPQGVIQVKEDESEEDGVEVTLSIDTSQTNGINLTESAGGQVAAEQSLFEVPASSSAVLMVTEMMIMAGEAMGKWGEQQNRHEAEMMEGKEAIKNNIILPYRSQKKPDFSRTERYSGMLDSLIQSNKGNGYCASWFSRRLFSPVHVSENPLPHSGMGLDCYVQWTSPIRRYSDLNVHAAVKRFLRREKINSLLLAGLPIPSEITDADIGRPLPSSSAPPSPPIDFEEGMGFVRACRPLQRKSQTYWMLEYLRRNYSNPVREFECTVLGCVNEERCQYTVFAHELGLEHRYLSEMGELEVGKIVRLTVGSVNPRMGMLTLTLSSMDQKGQSSRL